MSTKSEPVATATPSEEKKPKKATIEEFTFDRLSDALAYVFFYWISHSHLFNKIDIQPTCMHKYSSSLSLVPHSLIHMLI